MLDLLRNAMGAFGLALLQPVKNMIGEVVRDVMIEFTVDDPRAGGPLSCYKCGGETEHGVCPQCQPLAYARLPEE